MNLKNQIKKRPYLIIVLLIILTLIFTIGGFKYIQTKNKNLEQRIDKIILNYLKFGYKLIAVIGIIEVDWMGEKANKISSTIGYILLIVIGLGVPISSFILFLKNTGIIF